MHKSLLHHRSAIEQIVTRYGGSNIRIFGSVARGDDRPDSDIDLLIDLEQGRTLIDLIAIQHNLEKVLGRKVDVLTEHSISKYFRDEVLAEAIAF